VQRVDVIDSHTGGEPTRVVLTGGPELGGGSVAEQLEIFRSRYDRFRKAVVNEPRGSDVLVGALLTPPGDPSCEHGVIFFNNVGCLGMCGHGLIGVVRTLAHLGRVATGAVSIDTPVGRVSARIEDDGAITIGNVPARCHALDVAVSVPGLGTVTGDIAYGGNWFFIARSPGIPLEPGNVSELTRVCRDLLSALRVQNITGADGADIDHIELTAPSAHGDADAVNFVLCPGGAWDRSPCGTGTSAKLAVMHARSELKPRQRWRQQSVTGGVFTAWLEERNGELHPFIRGRAWITGEAQLRFEPDDPLRGGFSTP
jgi:4-hydroxyproline epimerase